VTAPILRLRILLIENDSAVADAIQRALTDAHPCAFDVEWVGQLSEGLARLGKKGIAAVLLNLPLPDSHAMETLEKLLRVAPDVPVLILGDTDDETLAKQAVARGAQDYLLPGHLDSYSLPRALRNAIERKAVEDALFVEKERAEVTLNSIGDAVLCTDISGNVTYLNLFAESMTGWRREEALGRPLAEVFKIIDGATRQTARDPTETAVERNETVRLTPNCILIRRDGFESAIEDSAAPIYDRAGAVTGAVVVFHDASAARAVSLELTHSAQHDFLTKLTNRMLLNDRLSYAISLARRHHSHIAVIFLDLDGFKGINDSVGHAIGDKLLQSVSNRLLAAVRGSDTVSRQGGDEFVILLSEIANAQDTAASAKKMLLSIGASHFIEGHDLHIEGSIGISIYPEDGEDAEALIKNADTAMYHAKENGRNNFQFFRADMNVRAVERRSLEDILRRALERNEFLLHYQPKVDLRTGTITGAEALIRWQHPDRGLVLPAEFVPLAEACGLILEIGRWVLHEACRQARAWQDAGLPPMIVAVNVSAVEFRDKDFLQGLRTILRETGLEARYLELELTESVLLQHAASTTSVLEGLKIMGVHLAVNDFGTGYSSLSCLRRFPVEVLKVERSFVQQAPADPDDAALLAAVINVGKQLKRQVVAEGIETREQLAFLQSLHCTEGQGYLFSRPLGAGQFTDLLQTGMAKTVLFRAECGASRAV